MTVLKQLGLPFGAPVVHSEEAERDDFTIATWNVNSLRARFDLLKVWLQDRKPDIVFMQETKIDDHLFPHETFAKLGYHAATLGQSQYNGVAILSRFALTNVKTGFSEQDDQARVIAATIHGIRVASIYAPNAHSTTDTSFRFKLEWLEKLSNYAQKLRREYPLLLLAGDFNVSPLKSDVHDQSSWLYQTFIHPDVRYALKKVTSSDFVDLHVHTNGPVSAYTWWDYRNDAFSRNNGIRIDLLYANKALASYCTHVWVDRKFRGAKGSSDHAPVLARFDLRQPKAGLL
jgi:exodeoxyribonuclease III